MVNLNQLLLGSWFRVQLIGQSSLIWRTIRLLKDYLSQIDLRSSINEFLLDHFLNDYVLTIVLVVRGELS